MSKDGDSLSHELISRTVGAAVQDRVQQLRKAERLKLRRKRRESRAKRIRGRLNRYWRDALDSLGELVATCAELGDLVMRAHAADTNLFRALELLRTRAVQIGWEVLELASAGYADGAYARWRTLHELAVVSEFLKKFGEDAATRYLEHAHIKNRKVIREYNECCNRLGYTPVPQTEIDRSDEVKDQLLRRYGPDFGNNWGWAAEACGVPDPSFFDLRQAAGYAHWKAHYGMANHAIHAGPHGVFFRLGHPLNSDPLPLPGPSLVGIGTPLDAAAISVMHVTFSFISAVRTEPGGDLDQELEITSSIQFIADLASQIQEQVLQASQVVEDEFGDCDSV